MNKTAPRAIVDRIQQSYELMSLVVKYDLWSSIHLLHYCRLGQSEEISKHTRAARQDASVNFESDGLGNENYVTVQSSSCRCTSGSLSARFALRLVEDADAISDIVEGGRRAQGNAGREQGLQLDLVH